MGVDETPVSDNRSFFMAAPRRLIREAERLERNVAVSVVRNRFRFRGEEKRLKELPGWLMRREKRRISSLLGQSK